MPPADAPTTITNLGALISYVLNLHIKGKNYKQERRKKAGIGSRPVLNSMASEEQIELC
jgi:hypothetical protein